MYDESTKKRHKQNKVASTTEPIIEELEKFQNEARAKEGIEEEDYSKANRVEWVEDIEETTNPFWPVGKIPNKVENTSQCYNATDNKLENAEYKLKGVHYRSHPY